MNYNNLPRADSTFWQGQTAYLLTGITDVSFLIKVLTITGGLITYIILATEGSRKLDFWKEGHTYTHSVDRITLRTLDEDQIKRLETLHEKVLMGTPIKEGRI